MGRLKSTADLPPLSEEKIQELLHLRRPLLTSPRYEAFNMFLYSWESDYLAFSKAGYVWEAEIKISRGDFLADLKNKTEKHRLLREAMKGRSTVPVPNHFVYVCPEGVIRPEDIEGLPYAGLLWVSKGGWFRWQTGVPQIHKNKCPFDDATLAEKFYYAMLNMAKRFWKKGVVDISGATRAAYDKTFNLYEEMIADKDWEISELKSLLKAAKIEIPKDLQ
jgi:hypothetical protein